MSNIRKIGEPERSASELAVSRKKNSAHTIKTGYKAFLHENLSAGHELREIEISVQDMVLYLRIFCEKGGTSIKVERAVIKDKIGVIYCPHCRGFIAPVVDIKGGFKSLAGEYMVSII